jgi:hypothetical protein
VNDRYLWDRSGEPDPQLEHLERVLGLVAHPEAPLVLPEGEFPAAPAASPAPGPAPRPTRITPRPPIVWRAPRLAWAAVLLAVLAGLVWEIQPRGWKVETLAGRPRIDSEGVVRTGRIGRGQWLETDASSEARLAVGRIGVVDVGPGSLLRVVADGAEHRLSLERGRLEAYVIARPRQFVVETPSANAVDLGCAYSLEVGPDLSATLTVAAGWVSFERGGRETFIPAGARCVTRVETGPGTPYFTDAAPALKNALVIVDLAGADLPDTALATVLLTARREDAFTLWHLIERASGPDRAEVVDRLAMLVTPPAGVTREAVLAGDAAALERWWNQLGFGAAADWRRWRDVGPGPTRTP